MAGDNDQAMRILLQTTVTHLDEVKDALDHPERMLDLGPYFRLRSVLRFLDLIDDAVQTIAPVGAPPAGGQQRDHWRQARQPTRR